MKKYFDNNDLTTVPATNIDKFHKYDDAWEFEYKENVWENILIGKYGYYYYQYLFLGETEEEGIEIFVTYEK